MIEFRDMIWKYSEKKSKKIPIALKELLDLRVKSVKKLKGGEVNHTFRVDTNKGAIIVRVFGYKHWPKEDTLRFIEAKLEELKIKQSKIIYFERSDKYFKYGFMVGEWVDGIPGDEAIRRGLIKKNKIVQETAKLLREIHTVKFDKFGKPLFKQKYGAKNFSSFVLNLDSKDNLERLVGENLVPGKLIESGMDLLRSLLNKIDFVVEPVMVHGDPTPENVIWTKRGPVLIDWDGAKATSWAYDAAWITYWLGEKAARAFFQGYAIGGIEMKSYKLLESIFHLALSLELLSYYAYSTKDKKRLAGAVKKMKTIVDEAGEL
jgi:aminoglycoside phosphotransferase (APT) family kinase protein